jgi:hypothetical protein
MSQDSLRARREQTAADVERRRRRVDDFAKRLADEKYQLAIEEARLSAFDEALRLSSDDADIITPSGARVEIKAKRGGRQVGAITEAWRKRLNHFYDLDASFDPQAMADLMAEEGAKTSRAEVSRTLSKHLEHGYVVLGPNSTFKVTDYAAQRFGFVSPKKTEAPESDSGASAISVQGPAGLPSGSPTQLPTDRSIRSGSTPVKVGSHSRAADPHAHSPGGLTM